MNAVKDRRTVFVVVCLDIKDEHTLTVRWKVSHENITGSEVLKLKNKKYDSVFTKKHVNIINLLKHDGVYIQPDEFLKNT